MNMLKMKFRISWGLSSVHSCHVDEIVGLRRGDRASSKCVSFHLCLCTANPVPLCPLGFLLNLLTCSWWSCCWFSPPVWAWRSAACCCWGHQPCSAPGAAESSALPAESLRRETAFAQRSLVLRHVHPDAKHTKTHPWHNQTSPNSDQHQRAASGGADCSIPYHEDCLMTAGFVSVLTNPCVTVRWGEEENKQTRKVQRWEPH